jgi:predicted dehydrogenase
MGRTNVAIIGGGLIGQKRAAALKLIPDFCLISIFDGNQEQAKKFAERFSCKQAKNFNGIIKDKQINLVILAISHKDAAELAPKILKEKDLLIEKPLGRNLKEARIIVNAARRNNHKLFVGFNFRFYPHIQEARKYLEKEKLGKIISSTFKIGHAASSGYEKTWKLDKELCGGGIILDPGVHMIDLMENFFGEPESWTVKTNKLGWKSEVEDEAFIIFEYKSNHISLHHYSLNLSQNTFFIEIVGTDGVIRIGGRGGNYGDMTFSYAPRWFWKTGKKIEEKNFGKEDNSFREELEFIDMELKISGLRSYSSYLSSMKILSKIYKNL